MMVFWVRLLTPFEFLMLSFVARELLFFLGYSWLLSFSCFCLFPAHVFFFFNKATHVFFLVRLLMPFEFLMLSFVAHEFVVFSFNKGYSWLLSFSFFLFPAHVCFAVRLLMPFEFPMLSFVAHEFFYVFFVKEATHDFWVSQGLISCSCVFLFF